MNELQRKRQPLDRASSARTGTLPMLLPVVLTNVGVLVVLLFGPNAQHPIVALAYAGAAVALVGLVSIVRRRAGDAFGGRGR